ncbi:VWA domain-containing protein [Salinispirillum sp. LH 10-3-1]|uniref:VWA domain-containing protein n=1 Tax=Salinispirillum sp. LH 10-3-1 TaxID=2952525 RepID=A0AB38YH61_9GAMM
MTIHNSQVRYLVERELEKIEELEKERALRRKARWNKVRLAVGAVLAAFLMGCGEPANQSRAAFVLVDISGDYAGELDKARTLSNYLLANLTSGDSLAIGFIDNSSFSERNIIARATFDHRPSITNQQKREFQGKVDAFLNRFSVPSHHSDITGGVLLATDYLSEVNAGQKYLFLLSDLHEDLPPWLNRNVTMSLDNVQVVAVNVKRQRSDNNDPMAYQQRLAGWQERIEAGGGSWQIVNDLARLESAVALR